MADTARGAWGGLRREAVGLRQELAALRRSIHRRPEIGLELPETKRAILSQLAGLDLEVTVGSRLSSVACLLRGAEDGPTVVLRADMDALPIQEASGEDFCSLIPGAMHACGHDLHVAMLVGALRLLVRRRGQLKGNVLALFQPGEEADDGAGVMLEEGALKLAGTPIVGAYALHVYANRLPRGMFGTRGGTIMAGSDGLDVVIEGEGGHGGTPWTARDPILPACEMITGLYATVTRSTSPGDPGIVSVGRVEAGTTRNVIPPTARFDATIRTMTRSTRDRVVNQVTRLCEGIARAHGVSATVTVTPGYPPTVNDEAAADRVRRTVSEVFGPERFHAVREPVTGSEDFSRILERVPGCMVFFGVGRGPDHGAEAPNHSPAVRFDDSHLPDGAALLASLTLSHLGTRPVSR